ncbi:hypothetical protein MNV49_000609 [Pseudohyphozyma bogoriensis]|nr:hypothetical protein MNV49_000609 [Pseudohyphozyma bogoriensis]
MSPAAQLEGLPFVPPSSRLPLTIACPIQGTHTLDPNSPDAVLLDLIASDAVQRLKGVQQHGISGVVGKLKGRIVDRYEHSVGAALLVRKLGATIEEQAAALLHDIAHTSLSHVVDGVYGYVLHEEDKDEYLATTNLPAILRAHNLDPSRVFEETNFSLLERDSPALCADRVDYAVRDSEAFGFLTAQEAREILADLVDFKGEMCFQTPELARKLSEAYMKSDEFAWSNPSHSALYIWAADTIKLALAHDQFTKADLWKLPDPQFWSQMASSPYPKVRSAAAKVRGSLLAQEVPLELDLEGGDELVFESRPRILDPGVVVVLGEGEKGRKSLSELQPCWGEKMKSYRTSKQGARRYRIVDEKVEA